MAVGASGDVLWGAFGDDASALFTGLGAQVDDPVGRADDVEVMFDDEDGVAGIDQGVEGEEEDADVVGVEAGGGFVEQEEGGASRGVGLVVEFGELGGEFQALAFPAGEGVDGLTQAEVTEADILEGAQGFGGATGGTIGWKLVQPVDGLVDGGGQDVGNVSGGGGIGGGCDADLEDVWAIAVAFALGTADEDIAEELHFDFFESGAAAAFALALEGIEAEGAGVEAALSGEVGPGEEFAEVIESADIDGGVGTWGPAEGGLIDEEDLGDLFGAEEPGGVLGGLACGQVGVVGGSLGGVWLWFVGSGLEMEFEQGVEDFPDEGGFSGAADAGDADEAGEGESDVEVFKIMAGGAFEAEVSGGLRMDGPVALEGGGAMSGEVEAGERLPGFQDLAGGALEDDLAAGFAVTGAEVDDLVGGAGDAGVVFDDDDGITEVAEFFDDGDESAGIAVVEADAGFIENVEGVDEAGAEAAGEVDAFGFTAGEGAGGAFEGEVLETDLDEVGETLSGFVEDEREVFSEAGGAGGDEGFDDSEGVADGEAIETGQGELRSGGGIPTGQLDGFSESGGDAIGEDFGLEASALAVRAGRIGAVSGEEDADVHFVGFGLEPAEVSFDAVPSAGPLVFGVAAVVGVTLDDPALVFRGEHGEGDIGGDSAGAAELEQVALAFEALAGLPGADGALGEGFGAIGEGLVVIDADDAAEAAAGGAGAEGVVEAEEGGGGLTVIAVAIGAMEAVGERTALGAGIGPPVEGEFAAAEVVGLFAGFREAGALVRGELNTILDDGQGRGLGGLEVAGGFFEADGCVVEPEALVALAFDQGERFGEGELGGEGELERDGDFAGVAEFGPDALGGVLADPASALDAVEFGQVRPQEFEVVADFGHGADGRAGGADGVALFDGDGRGDAIDSVDGGFIHAVEELAGVGGERFDITSLAFGEQGVEGERTFAGAAGTGDNDEPVEGQVEVEVLEVVVADAAEVDGRFDADFGHGRQM